MRAIVEVGALGSGIAADEEFPFPFGCAVAVDPTHRRQHLGSGLGAAVKLTRHRRDDARIDGADERHDVRRTADDIATEQRRTEEQWQSRVGA